MIKNIVYDIGMVLIDFAWAQAMSSISFVKDTLNTKKKFVSFGITIYSLFAPMITVHPGLRT